MTPKAQTQVVQHFCSHNFLFHGKTGCQLVVPRWRLSTVKCYTFYVLSGISVSLTVSHSDSNPFVFTIHASATLVPFSALSLLGIGL